MFLDEENYIIPQTNTVVIGTNWKYINCVQKILLTAGSSSLCRVLSTKEQLCDVRMLMPMLQARSWEGQHSVVTLMSRLGRRIGGTSGAAVSG